MPLTIYTYYRLKNGIENSLFAAPQSVEGLRMSWNVLVGPLVLSKDCSGKPEVPCNVRLCPLAANATERILVTGLAMLLYMEM